MANDRVYKKVGNKYVDVGYSYSGFPAEGVWLVYGNSSSCIAKLGELNDFHLPTHVDLSKYRIEVCNRVADRLKEGNISVMEIVDTVISEFSKSVNEEVKVDIPKRNW